MVQESVAVGPANALRHLKTSTLFGGSNIGSSTMADGAEEENTWPKVKLKRLDKESDEPRKKTRDGENK